MHIILRLKAIKQSITSIFLGILNFFKRKYQKHTLIVGIGIGFFLVFIGHEGIRHTSSDTFCGLCHVHPEATYSWKRSTHYKNENGVVVHCIECHLPPEGLMYFVEKARLGIKDAYGTVFKDTEKIDWESKSVLEHAVSYTFDSSCMKCHDDLYSLGLSPKGVQAHEYYMKMKDKITCINCHITVGHFQEAPVEEFEYLVEEKYEQPTYPSDTGEFANYTEIIPDTQVQLNMIAIPGGTFTMGSPESESYREDNESPQRRVRLNPFWMGETEVTWREFDVFYEQTGVKSKDDGSTTSSDEYAGSEDNTGVDAVTGPTPPYGSPDQGWGRAHRPAITMTYHATVRYCEWLSGVTGKKYRLPTEAEWEYACRAGTTGSYYFEGEPKKLTSLSWTNRLFGIDDSIIKKFVWYKGNSSSRHQPSYASKPNPWGLYNMPGNIKEFCLDWFSPDVYSTYPEDGIIENPRGPASGTEHVVRGGSYNSDPVSLRSAARDHTYHDRWLLTDPQSPKSIWWYSDSKDVGFRIVREYEGK